jgi:predicted nuclease with TOPRIM domain
MSVTCEKIEVEKKLDNIEKEKIQLASQIEELVKEKKKIEETFQLSKDAKSRLESQLVELTDVAMKQKITLVNYYLNTVYIRKPDDPAFEWPSLGHFFSLGFEY